MRPYGRALGLGLVLVGVAAPLSGQDRRPVDIHGFGGWSYGSTSANRFLGADEDGESAKTNFALKVTSTAISAVQINAQLFVRNGFDGSSTSLDYAFADWQLHNSVHLRVGKVKHPFGIYTEVAGLGTVRPFLNLPQAVYGPIAIVSKSYRGLGLQGALALAPGWSLNYDIYGGGIEFEQEESALDIFSSPEADSTVAASSVLFESEGVIGGRLVVETPVDGLSVGASAFSGRAARAAPGTDQRYVTVGGQGEWVVDRTWVRAEVAYQRDRIPAIDDRQTAYYVEGARFFGDHWQIAGLFSGLTTDVTLPPAFAAPDDLTRHRETAVGLNYWVSPEFGFKASYHWVEGNLIAELSQSDFQQFLFTRSSPHPQTRLFQFGAQFSF